MIRKWSVRGGNERVATELARFLLERGHDVRVVCQKVDPSTEGLFPSHFIHRLFGPSFDPTLAMLSFAYGARRFVRALRRARAVDVVMGFNHSVDQDVYRLGGGTHAEFMTRKTAARLSGGPVLDRVATLLERARFKPGACSTLIAPSQRVKSELITHYGVPPDLIEVIHNGVDLNRFSFEPHGADRLEERAAERTALGLAADQRVALFVGQDLQRKGFGQAVQATGKLGVTLLYVGQAEKPAGLPGHVVWGGERRDVERIYRASDVLVLPSHYDPFGGVVLEAYASGLPAVATERIGATELATQANSELSRLLIDDPEDIEGLCARLKIALEPHENARFSQAARALAKDFGLPQFGRKVEAALRRDFALRASPGRPDLGGQR